MKFSDVMQNLAIGIASGIFSSIIVSVVFYILNEFQNEITRAKDMTYSLYITIANSLISRQFNKPGLFEEAQRCLWKATEKFSRFEPWQFKGVIQIAMCSINNLLSDGKYYGEDHNFKRETWHELSDELWKQLKVIQECEKNFTKLFVKRIVKNKIIIATALIFVVIIIIA